MLAVLLCFASAAAVWAVHRYVRHDRYEQCSHGVVRTHSCPDCITALEVANGMASRADQIVTSGGWQAPREERRPCRCEDPEVVEVRTLGGHVIIRNCSACGGITPGMITTW